jgi:predicted ester cyclase
MDNPEKLERNKKFILQYATRVTGAGVDESVIRTFTDNESYIRGVMAFKNAFPDYTIFIEDMTAEGDFVIIHGVFRGTHKGEIFGIPATHRKVEYPMMVKYHVLNNKIIDVWPMFDQMSLFEQLGAISRPH